MDMRSINYLKPTLELTPTQEYEMCNYFFNKERCTNYIQHAVLCVFANVLYDKRYEDSVDILNRCKRYVHDVLNRCEAKNIHTDIHRYVFDCILGYGAFSYALTTGNTNYVCIGDTLYLTDFEPQPINIYTAIVCVVFGRHSGLNNQSVFQTTVALVTTALRSQLSDSSDMYKALLNCNTVQDTVEDWLLYNVVLTRYALSVEDLLVYVILCGYNFNECFIPHIGVDIGVKAVVGDTKVKYLIKPMGVDVDFGKYETDTEEDVLGILMTPRQLPTDDLAEDVSTAPDGSSDALKKVEEMAAKVDTELLDLCDGDVYKALLLKLVSEEGVNEKRDV